MAVRTHLVAFNRSVRAFGLDQDPVGAAIVYTGRDLARQLDSMPDDKFDLRLVMMYRQMLKELPRWAVIAQQVEARKLPKPAPTSPRDEGETKKPTPLAAFREKHGVRHG